MVLYVEVLAIGPFNRDLTAHYEYPQDYYSRTRNGAPIVTTLFGIIEGTNIGAEFAATLGVTDPWDFNQHKIDPGRIDFAALSTLLSPLEDADDYLRQLEALRAFASAGYDLYLLPNG